MMTRRSNINAKLTSSTADACFAAMERHDRRGKLSLAGGSNGPPPPPSPPAAGGAGTPPSGDIIIYGGRAIARRLFNDDSNKARRRVFNLWAHYRDRKEQAGFFKLKGALCLSISVWLKFHGLA